VKQAKTNRTRGRGVSPAAADRPPKTAVAAAPAHIPHPAARKRRRLEQHPHPDKPSKLKFIVCSPGMTFQRKKTNLNPGAIVTRRGKQ
jgi:hypothetical protein